MKKSLFYVVISFSVVVLGMFVYPRVFQNLSVYYFRLDVGIMIGLLSCLFAVLFATAFLFSEQSKISIGKAMIKSFVTYLCMGVIVLLMSFLSGVIAEVLYGLLKSVKSIDEIKGYIDIIVRILNLLVLPLLITIFWKMANHQHISFKQLLPKGMEYLKLLGLSIGLFLLGNLLQVIHPNTLGTIIRTILLIGLGTIGFYLTEIICKVKPNTYLVEDDDL